MEQQNAVPAVQAETVTLPAVSFEAPTTVEGWLLLADAASNTTYNAVREAAILAADTVVEFDAGTVITADIRAKAVREKFRDTLNKLSETNRGNISAWFAGFLVLQYTAAQLPDADLEIEAPKGKNGAVTVKAADAVKLPKNKMLSAAKSARAIEGTSGNRANSGAAGQTEGGTGTGETAAGAHVDTSQKLTPEAAALVTMWAQIDTLLAKIDGLTILRDGLKTRGYTLNAYIEPEPEPEAEPEAEPAPAPAKPAKGKK